jgi:hypothetical protein
VAALLALVSRRILRTLERCGRLRRTEDGYELVSREEPDSESASSALASCQAASVRGRIAFGPRAGTRVQRSGDRIEADWAAVTLLRPRCAERDGFSLHGDVEIGPHDRHRLERLCRYILRPPIATERLRERDDGRIEYELRKPWRDGTTGFVFEPLELLERLVALVPAPRGHLVRYHGVLAPRSRWRASVVRDRGDEGAATATTRSDGEPAVPSAPDTPKRESWFDPVKLRQRRLTWAELMQRVFEVDVLECPRCKGRRRLIAVLTDPEVIVPFLESIGVASRAPPVAPAREEGGEPGEQTPSWTELG